MRWIMAFAIALLAVPATAQRPGDLIAADPVVQTPAGMQAWRISYWTTTDRGKLRQATGMVVAPREAIPARPRNIIAWTHGAWGVATRCAPSLSPNFWRVTAGLDGIARGHVVVAPDYPGLASAGVHPFLAGQDTGRSVLDAVRAARTIPGAAAGDRVAIWGESQGGHGALWTAQIARAYARELQVVGVAAAAPPTNLIENLRQSPNKSVKTLFTAFIGHSWSNHYGAPLATLGGPQTRGIITRLAQNNCVELEQKPKLGTIAGILTLQHRLRSIDLGNIQPWARLARLNSPTTTSFGMPMLIGQNAKDDLIAPALTRAHARALCRSRAQLRWVDIAGLGHATSAKDSSKVTLDWIDDRFAGRRPPSDCGRF
jgi:acetyl esterase/lipase